MRTVRVDSTHDYADGLRRLADFIDAHPDLFRDTCELTVNLFAENREEFAEKARQLGSAEKVEMGGWYVLRKKFGPHRLDLNIAREYVCTQVQTGTRTVSKPDPEVLATVPTVEVEEPVYEWQCPDSLLRPATKVPS